MERSRGIARRWMTAGILLLAAVAGAVLPCLCASPEPAAGHTADHACCARPTGLQAVDASCCSHHEGALESSRWTSPDSIVLVVPSCLAFLPATPLAIAASLSVPPQRPVSGSPPLRI